MNVIQKILSTPFYDNLNRVSMLWYKLKGAIFYKHVFGSFGRGSAVFKPMLISNPRFVHIGANTIIRSGVRIEAVMFDPANPPEIRIGDNVNIEQGVHIVAIGKIHIKDNVSITARTCILGGNHPFFDIHSPVKIGYRLEGADSLTVIGEGSFLGVGSVVQMNATIGRHVVVGSNSVVKGNIPDYTVVNGNPAVPALQYDQEDQRWRIVRAKR